MTRSPSTRALAFPVVVVFAFRLLAALAVAYPAAQVAASAFTRGSPDDDLALFAPGGFELLELLRIGGRAVSASLRASTLVLAGLSVIALGPLGVALAALLSPSSPRGELVGRGVGLVPRFLVLSGLTVLAQAVLAALGGFATSAVAGPAGVFRSERTAELVSLAPAFAAALLAVLAGVANDLSRAAVAAHGATWRAAAGVGLRTLVRRPGAVLGGYLGRAAIGVALVALAARATTRLDVHAPGSGRVLAVLAIHQATVLALVVLRVLWLRRSLELVGPPAETADG